MSADTTGRQPSAAVTREPAAPSAAGNRQRIQAAIECLAECVSARRRARIEKVLAQRTRYVTVVLEDIYQAQNASAVVRSCECLGLQDIYAIENYNAFVPHTDVMQGAGKWVDIHHCGEPDGCNTSRCLASLVERGYRIAATGFGPDSIAPEELPLDRPVAVCIGTEEVGLSDAAFDLADLTVQIPMYGFTQSFNLSVSAALCLQPVCRKLRSTRRDWGLCETERLDLCLKWMMKSVRRPELILRKGGFEDMLKMKNKE